MARVDVTVFTTKYGQQDMSVVFDEFVDQGLFEEELDRAVEEAVDTIITAMNYWDSRSD